jgi:carboxymethylenebutenolidase
MVSHMDTRTVQLETPDGTMATYEAVPGPTERPKRGAVIVIQEAFGVNAHIEDVTRRCASAGYHAVAPHLFHRTGDPSFGYDDFSLVLEHVGALDDDAIRSDLQATLGHLQAASWSLDQIGVVGFCMGGRASFLAAGSFELGAAVGFYGAGIVTPRSERVGSLLHLIPTMRTPWLGLFGDEDQSIPVADVERLRSELAGAPVGTDVVRYPGAEHGFHCDARPSYAPTAAADGWRRTLDWLDHHLAPVAPPEA